MKLVSTTPEHILRFELDLFHITTLELRRLFLKKTITRNTVVTPIKNVQVVTLLVTNNVPLRKRSEKTPGVLQSEKMKFENASATVELKRELFVKPTMRNQQMDRYNCRGTAQTPGCLHLKVRTLPLSSKLFR